MNMTTDVTKKPNVTPQSMYNLKDVFSSGLTLRLPGVKTPDKNPNPKHKKSLFKLLARSA